MAEPGDGAVTTASPGPGPVEHVVVAVPAKNEELLLPTCLHSIEVAAAALQARRPVPVAVVVALDGCTDETPHVAARHGAISVDTADTGVGRARDVAIALGLRTLGPQAYARTWVGCTDADTVVPPQWLIEQVRLADHGADLVLGTAQPTTSTGLRWAAWHDRHQLVDGHPYVHGANLGLRASVWAEVGGFGPLRAHEDVDLVARARGRSYRCLATDSTRVTTSARPHGRVAGGFADYLRELDEPVP